VLVQGGRAEAGRAEADEAEAGRAEAGRAEVVAGKAPTVVVAAAAAAVRCSSMGLRVATSSAMLSPSDMMRAT